MRSLGFFALALSSALLLSSTSFAASYGSFAGTNYTYENVADGAGLYGAPTISGNLLDFSPTSYSAQCPGVGCPPSPIVVDDTLIFHVQSNAGPGNEIGGITISEAGDTTLSSFLNAFAATSVSAPIHIQVEEVNGIPLSISNPGLIVRVDTTLVFTNGGLFTSTGVGYGTTNWTGTKSVDIDALLAAAGVSGRATRIDFSMDNVLQAYADSGATALIKKKDLDGLTVHVTPEPGTALLLGLGLAGLASVRRRTA